jgi:hypothetical protein
MGIVEEYLWFAEDEKRICNKQKRARKRAEKTEKAISNCIAINFKYFYPRKDLLVHE